MGPADSSPALRPPGTSSFGSSPNRSCPLLLLAFVHIAACFYNPSGTPDNEGADQTEATVGTSGLDQTEATVASEASTAGADQTESTVGTSGTASTGEDTKPSCGELAAQTLNILDKNCKKCHGPDSAAFGSINYITNLDALITNGQIVPGEPNNSVIYRRMSATMMPMPPVGQEPRPSEDDIRAVEQWIAECARPSCDQLAARTLDILDKNCKDCHGPDSAALGSINYITNLDALITNGKVVPGEPNNSAIYQRMSATMMPMPPVGQEPRPSEDDIGAVEQWIAECADGTTSA